MRKIFTKKTVATIIMGICILTTACSGNSDKTEVTKTTKINTEITTVAETPNVIEVKQETIDNTEDILDLGTKNAYDAGKNYLNLMAFSKQGLIDQLSSEYGDNYTVKQATDAVQLIEDNGEVNWNEEAAECAKNYLEMTSFSKQDLIDQLTSEYGDKFTLEQAEYAVSSVGY